MLGEKGINGIKLTGDVNHLAQGGGAGHVHAVVVAGGKIGGDEAAVGKLGGELGIACEQVVQREAVSFGLQ